MAVVRKEAAFTRLQQAGHPGHGRAVSGGPAQVGGAARPLPAALVGGLHAAAEKMEIKNWSGFGLGRGRPGTAVPGISAVLPVRARSARAPLLPGAPPLVLLVLRLEPGAATPGQASLPRRHCGRIAKKVKGALSGKGQGRGCAHAGWPGGGAAEPDWPEGWSRCSEDSGAARVTETPEP